MIEVDFKDRVPTHAGRIKLTPVDGQPDFFTMERADDPTETGTPIDKATFDSVVKSRLTGRYYTPSVVKETISSRDNITVNPLPTSGWMRQSMTKATSGEYEITASGSFGDSYSLENATDGNQNTEWISNEYANGNGAWWQIKFPSPIVATAIQANLEDLSGNNQTFVLQGSTNGATWVELTRGSFGKITGMKQYNFANTNEYAYYRMYFTGDNEYNATMIEFAIANYSIKTYRNSYTLAKGAPASWTIGQRVLIQTPPNVSTAGVHQNNLNDINITTILQPSKRYELTYNGTAFYAKEV